MNVRTLLINFLILSYASLNVVPAGFAQTATTAKGQPGGTLRGIVTLEASGAPVHDVTVTISQLRLSAQTDEKGVFEFKNVPPGKYEVIAHLDRVPDQVHTVEVSAATVAVSDFALKISGVRDEVTVTATGSEELSVTSMQSVDSVGSIQIAQKNPVSIGEVLEGEVGVAKRSFGPGTSRPVIRGFDGDRVLVLQDGNSVGGLGSQSGDHAEPIDVMSADKVEVVKGPAVLLYGSSASGGVVNAVTGHDSAHAGLRGYLTGLAATNSNQAGGSGGFEYGVRSWLLWGNGGAQRSGDYSTPLGRVRNSFTRDWNGAVGFGYYPQKGFFSIDYDYDNRDYGIPIDFREENPEIVHLTPRRHSVQLKGGFRDSGDFLDRGTFSIQYNDYHHSEVNSLTGLADTSFDNKSFVYRGVFDERRGTKTSGSFGLSGLHRNFDSSGEEVVTPPATQNAFAVFGLQSLNFDKVGLQFGGRVEHNGYDPVGFQQRAFNGFSGAAGLRVSAWPGGALVANFSHSYRAPTLEELYNHGPHRGNLTFEIGDPNLKPEQSDGIDFAVRHSSERAHVEVGIFYYHFDAFVFLAPTGEIEDGLPVAKYSQGAARFLGFESKADIGLTKYLRLDLGSDYVNAKLTETDTPLPRIPPFRTRVGLQISKANFQVTPEAVMVKDQDNIFPTETRTAGYTIFNLAGSYTLARQHIAHVVSVNAFNLGDRLYLNHLSFIKDIAPEIGRGVRLSYTVRFF